MKPWSQGGAIPESGHWPEWKAAARNYLTILALVLVGVFLAGFQCARVLAHRPDPALAGEQRHAAVLRDSLRQERARQDSLDEVIAVLESTLEAHEAVADSAHHASLASEAGITITAVDTVPLDPSVMADTVRYADVQRANDARHYAVPRFFTDSYLKLRADRDAAYVVAHDQQDIIAGQLARGAVTDSMLAAHDSIDAANARVINALQRQGHPRCGFKCGVLTTVALGVSIRYVVKR